MVFLASRPLKERSLSRADRLPRASVHVLTGAGCCLEFRPRLNIFRRDLPCVFRLMDQPASSCMRNAHPGSAIWGCMRGPHSAVPSPGLPPYQQGPFSLHQKPEFLAYTDFPGSCLVSAAPHAYPRDDRPYADSGGPGYQRPDWQFPACGARARGQEPCPAGSGTAEVDDVGLDRLPGSVSGCLEGEYSPPSMAPTETEKKTSKRKREVAGQQRFISIG